MEGFLTTVVLLACFALMIGIGAWLKSNMERSARTDASVKQHTICPHCGNMNEVFAADMPDVWNCSECACRYTPSGSICASSQNQYDRIDAWDSLEAFIEKVLKVTENSGFITLQNGYAFICRPGMARTQFADYPCDGLDRDGELHLMLLCMRRCRENYARKGIEENVRFWLMERGLAWEYDN